MKNKLINLSTLLAFATTITSIHASENSDYHSLKSDMTHTYITTPKTVSYFPDVFFEGEVYPRLRSNTFVFEWDQETKKNNGDYTKKNHLITGIGGSLVWKSAYFKGYGMTAGMYSTAAYGNLDKDESNLYKAGKDTFSRFDYLTENRNGIAVWGELYLEYKEHDQSIKAGRQIFESFLTRSNDTKMIPNTFEGLTIHSDRIENTKIKSAYLTKQKLRDHSKFHHLLAYDDKNDGFDKYSENDDSAMHKGITLQKLEENNIEDRLFIFEVTNNYIENLTLNFNYTLANKLLSYKMFQADYTINFGQIKVIPGLRYMQQSDEGAGAIAGANLLNDTTAYTNPNNLDSSLYAARIVAVQDNLKMRLGYSKVANKGDLVAPWRGFPTGGFTRAMGQYNWNANTESLMAQFDYNFKSIPDFQVSSKFVLQDFDDNKTGVSADTNVFTLDFMKKLKNQPLFIKTRFACVSGDKDTIVETGNLQTFKPNPSYNEFRLELNYLF